MKVGVIGVGVAGASHLFDLVSSEAFQVVAVCTTTQARADAAAATFGVTAGYDDPQRMLTDVIPDAVVIAVPPAATPATLEHVLAVQLPVLVEKPAGPDADTIRAVVNGAPEAGIRCAVAYNRRYQYHVHLARDILGAGTIGPISTIRCTWAAPFALRYTGGHTYRRTARFGDGVILDTLCHILDTLAFIGIDRTPTVHSSRFGHGPTGADTHGVVELYTSDGAPITIHIDDTPEEGWSIEVTGRNGELRITRDHLSGDAIGQPCDVKAQDLHRPVDDLLHLRDGGTPLGATLQEACAVLDVIDSVRAAACSSRPWQRPRAKAHGRLNGAC